MAKPLPPPPHGTPHTSLRVDDKTEFLYFNFSWQDWFARFYQLLKDSVVRAYEIQIPSTASVDLTAVAATTILDVTEAGKILGIAIRVSAGVSGTVPVATLGITTDGGTERNISLYASALTWAVGVREFSRGSGEDGDAAGDRVILPGDVIYSKSMKVSVDVTTAAGSAGTLQVSVLRAKGL